MRRSMLGGGGAVLVAIMLATVALADNSPPAGTLSAGGLRSLPTGCMTPVPMINPGFEDGLKGWRTGTSNFSAVDTSPHGGAKCLRFETSSTKGIPPVLIQQVKVPAGIYILRFWVRAKNVEVEARSGTAVSAQYGTGAEALNFDGTFDWRQEQLRFAVPADNTKGVIVRISQYGKVKGGELFVDDFTLQRQAAPDVEAYLRYPNYRGYLPEDGPQTVKLWVRVNKAGAKDPAEVVVTSASGATVASQMLPSGVQEQVVELDGSKWPLGRYTVTARMRDYSYPGYALSKISAKDRAAMGTWFDANNVLYVQGKPVFPLGLYNTVAHGIIDDNEIKRLDKMKEAPVNFSINYTWWGCGMEARRRYLTAMNDRGMFYLDMVRPFADSPPVLRIKAESFEALRELLPGTKMLGDVPTTDRYLALLAGKMRPLAGFAGWYVMDEGKYQHVPEFFHMCDLLRQADPDHPNYGVSNKPDELVYWRDVLDVFGVDPYPLMGMRYGKPLSMAGQWTTMAVDATQQSRPVWTVIQYFQGWIEDRWPTAEELRSMSLMAITDGARGLFYWSFGGRGLGMAPKDKQEEDWQNAVRLIKELKGIEPALVAPEAPEVVKSVSDAKVHWRARIAGGKWYVFAYLPAEKFKEREKGPEVKVTFTFKDGQTVQKTFRPDVADWFAVVPK